MFDGGVRIQRWKVQQIVRERRVWRALREGAVDGKHGIALDGFSSVGVLVRLEVGVSEAGMGACEEQARQVRREYGCVMLRVCDQPPHV